VVTTKRSIADKFKTLLGNLRTQNDDVVRSRRRAITKRLNQDFWGSYSETEHTRFVGSYGRGTEIRGASDVDLLARLPSSLFGRYDSYLGNGQSALLQNVRDSIRKTYTSTDVGGDEQVVVVRFSDGIKFEVVPAFIRTEGSYSYPDSNDGGSWKTMDPIPEIEAIDAANVRYNKKVKHLARMARAWRTKNSVPMNGLLIDTLVYNFMADWEYNDKSFMFYDWMTRDFLKHLYEQNRDRSYWYAPGSNQRVYRSGIFEYKAGQAYREALEAIRCEDQGLQYSADEHWKNIFGPFFTS
jgi:hypothetical protein